MAKINVGDLVCMYRRKKKGMGIVLEKVDDVVESAGIEGMTFEQLCADLNTLDEPRPGSLLQKYNARREYGQTLLDKAARPELLRTCMIYNSSWAKKPKKVFVRIRWFERPSYYETSEISEAEEWCPIDWLRKV